MWGAGPLVEERALSLEIKLPDLKTSLKTPAQKNEFSGKACNLIIDATKQAVDSVHDDDNLTCTFDSDDDDEITDTANFIISVPSQVFEANIVDIRQTSPLFSTMLTLQLGQLQPYTLGKIEWSNPVLVTRLEPGTPDVPAVVQRRYGPEIQNVAIVSHSFTGVNAAMDIPRDAMDDEKRAEMKKLYIDMLRDHLPSGTYEVVHLALTPATYDKGIKISDHVVSISVEVRTRPKGCRPCASLLLLAPCMQRPLRHWWEATALHNTAPHVASAAPICCGR